MSNAGLFINLLLLVATPAMRDRQKDCDREMRGFVDMDNS